MKELWVTVREQSGWAVLSPQGKIMFDTHEPLGEALNAALARPAPRIVIDLHEVVLCDSSGLQLLLDARRKATSAGGELRLCRTQPLVQRVLEVTNLTSILPVHATVEAAVSAAGRGSTLAEPMTTRRAPTSGPPPG
jgi:anti-sigma B factor antagonist